MTKPYPHQPLGNFIRAVDVRNSSGAVTRLLGVSVNKCFIPSVANTIGTDMTKYKVVRKGQFACNLIHVGRDEVIPISLYDQEEDALLSSAYDVFEIVDETELLPEYLRLCVMRPEFDRYATFQAVYGIRGNLPWEDFCEIEIPVPPIAEQERIVSQFATIEERMRQCRERIALLERTATAVYRKTFVEGIDRNHLPDGWRMGTLGEVFELQRGYDLPSQERTDGVYPICSSNGITAFHNEYKVEPPCVFTGRSGTIGQVFYVEERCWPLNTSLWVKDFKGTPPLYVYYKLKELELDKRVAGFAAVPTLNRNDVHCIESTIPSREAFAMYDQQINIVHQHKVNQQRQLTSLEKLKAALLTQIK